MPPRWSCYSPSHTVLVLYIALVLSFVLLLNIVLASYWSFVLVTCVCVAFVFGVGEREAPKPIEL